MMVGIPETKEFVTHRWHGKKTAKHGKYVVVVTKVVAIERVSPWYRSCEREWYVATGTVNGKPFTATSTYGSEWGLRVKAEPWRALKRTFAYRVAVAKAAKAAYEAAGEKWWTAKGRKAAEKIRRRVLASL